MREAPKGILHPAIEFQGFFAKPVPRVTVRPRAGCGSPVHGGSGGLPPQRRAVPDTRRSPSRRFWGAPYETRPIRDNLVQCFSFLRSGVLGMLGAGFPGSPTSGQGRPEAARITRMALVLWWARRADPMQGQSQVEQSANTLGAAHSLTDAFHDGSPYTLLPPPLPSAVLGALCK